MTSTTRRTLVLAGAAGAALAPLLAAPDVFAAATSRRDLYARGRFKALRGRSFRLHGPTRSWRVRLDRVGNLAHTTRRDPDSFSLTFTAASRGPEQGSYVLRRRGFRSTTLFVVPSDVERRTYEVTVLRKPCGGAAGTRSDSLASVKKVLVVTGSGRSGTSSVAGTLKRLGFHIPQPEVETDERNPRGYYEPLWVAEFHKHWLNAIPVRTIDSRPDAGDIAMADLTPEREEQLRSWLADELATRPDGDTLIVKETRAYWVYPLWRRVVAAVGGELASLTMLRHPAQVVRSRDSAYLTGRTDELRRQRETTNVAAWMNSVFVTERATRDNARAFVPYYDLIGDWRAAMTRACDQLSMPLGDVAPPHPVDDFVTASLNRSAATWEGLAVPDVLVDLAERTWSAAHVLVDKPDDADASSALDALHDDYVELYRTSNAIVSDETSANLDALRDELEARLAVKNQRLDKLRRKVREAEARIAELEARTAGGPA